MTCKTLLCVIALRNKMIVLTSLPSFDNANGRLDFQERLLRPRNSATMVT